jgi:uncharacterized protein HemY
MGLLAFSILLAAQPVKRLLSSMWADHCLAGARAAIERQDFLAAMEAVQKAGSLTPQDPEMLRTRVRVLLGLNAHPDEVLSTLAQIEAVGGMTPEMLLKRAEAQLIRGDLPAAQQALHALPQVPRQSWEAVQMEATLLLRQGRAAEAAERLQSTAGTAHTPDAAFRRAVLDLAVTRGPQQI